VFLEKFDSVTKKMLGRNINSYFEMSAMGEDNDKIQDQKTESKSVMIEDNDKIQDQKTESKSVMYVYIAVALIIIVCIIFIVELTSQDKSEVGFLFDKIFIENTPFPYASNSMNATDGVVVKQESTSKFFFKTVDGDDAKVLWIWTAGKASGNKFPIIIIPPTSGLDDINRYMVVRCDTHAEGLENLKILVDTGVNNGQIAWMYYGSPKYSSTIKTDKQTVRTFSRILAKK
jgi:hypothetical protein